MIGAVSNMPIESGEELAVQAYSTVIEVEQPAVEICRPGLKPLNRDVSI